LSKIIKCVSLHSNPKIITTPQQCIIKVAPESPPPESPSSVENDVVYAAQQDADNILRGAAERATQLIAEAEEAAEAIKLQSQQEGYQSGFVQGQQEGYQAGLSQAENEIQLAHQRSTDLLVSAQKQADIMVMNAEKQLVELSLSIARKILKREIDENPMTILPIVKEALGKVQDAESIVIRVNPEDTEVLQMAKRDLQQVIGGDKALSIIADYTINPGGCMIDTKLGTVDATIDTQFEAIKQAVQHLQP